MSVFSITYKGPMSFFLEGELDIASVPAVQAALNDSIGAGGPITLDLSGLTFIDSSGVSAILKAAKDHLPGGCVVLHGVHDGTQKVIGLMGVEMTSNIHVIPCVVAA